MQEKLKESGDIDFVIAWVDGNDPVWQKEKIAFQGGSSEDASSAKRFRDWGTLKYWFRAVEKYTPWVRKIHFVTWGHLPEFLNTDNPKLHIVRHQDYLPPQYRPTFNANTIELNFHRIEGLSEKFVYFNDDMFVLRRLSKDCFFANGLPCTFGGEIPAMFMGENGIWQHLIVNDLRVINNHFNKAEQVHKHGSKYISRVYGYKDNIRTKVLQKFYPGTFLGFKNLHAPAAFLKTTLKEIWSKEPELLEATCLNRFRTNDDVNQWLVLWWQIASGTFYPYGTDNFVKGTNDQTIEEICSVISGQKHDMICCNDAGNEENFGEVAKKLISAFECILPEKSSFEK